MHVKNTAPFKKYLTIHEHWFDQLLGSETEPGLNYSTSFSGLIIPRGAHFPQHIHPEKVMKMRYQR